MKKLSFKMLQIPVDLKETKWEETDVRKRLGDHIYQNTSGMANFKLAEKIYDSGDHVELNDEEINLLIQFLNLEILFLPIERGIRKSLGIEKK